MEISLSNIKEIGFRKINNVFLEHKKDILSAVKEISYLTTGLKVSKLTFLNNWDELSNSDSQLLTGIKAWTLANNSELSLSMLDANVKRKFMRDYDSFWKKYSRSYDFSDFESKLISDVGLLLPMLILDKSSLKHESFSSTYIAKLDKLFQFACEYFNALFLWSVLTQSEAFLINRSYTLLDMLFVTSLNSDTDFVDLLGTDELFNVCKKKG